MSFGNTLQAQHSFKGYIDNDRWHNEVYLSVIDDYRTLENINDEQIISKATTDDNGFFEFQGNQLESTNKIYKLHVDNCSEFDQNSKHFQGHCEDSNDIIFIAKSNDTLVFPLGFEDQIFCKVASTNPKTSAFIKIDSLKEEMKYAYGEYRSQANRTLNNKKWFKTLQDFGKSLNEPLAELYIYAFLSDRSNNLHSFYLEDLKTNTYYDDLLNRLKATYPNSPYTKQYAAELTSDEYIISSSKEKFEDKSYVIPWLYVLFILLLGSVLLNIWFLHSKRKQKSKINTQAIEQLTSQEQKVLELLLDNHTNKDIANTLYISVSTVKTHVNNLYRKLNVTSRDEVKLLFNK